MCSCSCACQTKMVEYTALVGPASLHTRHDICNKRLFSLGVLPARARAWSCDPVLMSWRERSVKLAPLGSSFAPVHPSSCKSLLPKQLVQQPMSSVHTGSMSGSSSSRLCKKYSSRSHPPSAQHHDAQQPDFTFCRTPLASATRVT